MSHKKLKSFQVNLVDSRSGYKKSVLCKTYELPNGLVETFFIDNDKDSVQIFAITKTGNVLCVKQFRAGPEKEQLELPGGGLEKGEDPVEAAQRELLEETGHKGSKCIPIGKLPYSPYSTGNRHACLIVECEKVARLDLDPNEFLEVLEVPLKEFREHMKKGTVRGFDLGYMALDHLSRL
jgi:ADP-ribose pyrophosphatase